MCSPTPAEFNELLEKVKSHFKIDDDCRASYLAMKGYFSILERLQDVVYIAENNIEKVLQILNPKDS